MLKKYINILNLVSILKLKMVVLTKLISFLLKINANKVTDLAGTIRLYRSSVDNNSQRMHSHIINRHLF